MAVSIDLSGRTAWVTGGASGIGAAIVAALREAGARVVSLDRSYRVADQASAPRASAASESEPWPFDPSTGSGSFRAESGDDRLRATLSEVEGWQAVGVGPHGKPSNAVPLDLRDSAAVAATVAALLERKLAPDILVNNAGITHDAVVWKMTDEMWQDVIDVNLTGAFRMTRAAAPHMRAARRGVIVNVASINALRGKFGQANYAASKGGLVAFTKAIARELAREGIRVNAVAPGFIETPLTTALPAAVRAQAAGEVLLGRLGRPEDVANAVLFLVSPLAAHITGHVLVVDGGQIA